MSPGDWEGHAKELAAIKRMSVAKIFTDIVRKEREARDRKRVRAPRDDN